MTSIAQLIVLLKSLQNSMLLIIEFSVFIGLVGLLIFIQSKNTIFFILTLGFLAIFFDGSKKHTQKIWCKSFALTREINE